MKTGKLHFICDRCGEKCSCRYLGNKGNWLCKTCIAEDDKIKNRYSKSKEK